MESNQPTGVEQNINAGGARHEEADFEDYTSSLACLAGTDKNAMEFSNQIEDNE